MLDDSKLAGVRLVVDAANDWIPDVARFADVASSPDFYTSLFDPERPFALRVPKPNGRGDRSTVAPCPSQRIRYQQLVQRIAWRIPAGDAYSARLRKPNSLAMLRSPWKAWSAFQSRKVAMASSHRWTAEADVKNFFNSIKHAHLLHLLSSHGAGDLTEMQTLLTGWFPDGKRIPQNLVPSTFIADRYLGLSVDIGVRQFIADSRIVYIRYMDDFFLGSDSKAAMEDAVARIREHLALADLSLNQDKVRIGAGTESIQRDSASVVRRRVIRATEERTYLDPLLLIEWIRCYPAMVESVARYIDANPSLRPGMVVPLLSLLKEVSLAKAWERMWIWRALFSVDDKTVPSAAAMVVFSDDNSDIEKCGALCVAADLLDKASLQRLYDRASIFPLRRMCVWAARRLKVKLSLRERDSGLEQWLAARELRTPMPLGSRSTVFAYGG